MIVETYHAKLHVGGMFKYVAAEAFAFLRELAVLADPDDEGDILVGYLDPHEALAIWTHCRASGVKLTLSPNEA